METFKKVSAGKWIKNLLFVAIIGLVFPACNKDQAVVKDLHGNWGISSLIENGTPVDASEYNMIRFEFSRCKVKKADCLLYIIDTKNLDTSRNKYSVTEKGTKITFKYLAKNSDTVVFTETATIKEHSPKKVVFEFVDGSDITLMTLEP